MVSNMALWNRIACFTLDDPSADFRFTDRLARENGWSRAFAARAVEEYKRFVYLAAISARDVTPSDVVDQVWHLHLTFTRSYWDELCGAVLQQKLHHGPTKGGRAEARRYRVQYAATLALYAQEFGQEAPAAFWPGEAQRFSDARHQRWIDGRTHWAMRKPNFGAWVGILGGSTLVALATAGAANGAEQAQGGADVAPIVVGGVVAVAILLFAMMMGRARRGRRSKDGEDTSWIVATGVGGSGKGKGKDGGEGGEGGGGEGGGSGCGGGGCSG